MHPGLPFILRWLYQVWHKLMYYRLDELIRGGIDVRPRLGANGIIERNTGLRRTDRGIFLFDDPGQVEGFGVAYTMKSIPERFKTLQRGRDAVHDELMPPEPMTILGQSRDGCR
jgi:hypothetical protein